MEIKNLNRQGEPGDWAIAFNNDFRPVLFAQIISVRNAGYILSKDRIYRPFWANKFCATFSNEEEAFNEFERLIELLKTEEI